MKDPRRMLEEDASDFESELLRSAESDAPSNAARDAARAALGIKSTAVSAAPSTPPTALPMKAIALIAGGIALSVVIASIAIRPNEKVEATAPAPVLAEDPIPANTAAISDEVESPALPETQPRLDAPLVQKRQASKLTPKRNRDPSASLRDAIELIDGAKLALKRGDARAADELLNAHHRKFPDGVLSIEAQALRIEARVVAGDRDDARILLETFKNAHPESALIERLNSLVY